MSAIVIVAGELPLAAVVTGGVSLFVVLVVRVGLLVVGDVAQLRQ